MTALNKQALRQTAEKAISEEGLTWWSEEQLASDYGLALHRADAAFIAAANPVTMLALLDENLQLQRDKDSLEAVAIAMREDMRDAREKLEAAEKHIAELEAREVAVKQFDDFQIVHYGGSEDYAKGYIDCQNNYNKALTAAGIGVKGE